MIIVAQSSIDVLSRAAQFAFAALPGRASGVRPTAGG
jgi:hypothetical protein